MQLKAETMLHPVEVTLHQAEVIILPPVEVITPLLVDPATLLLPAGVVTPHRAVEAVHHPPAEVCQAEPEVPGVSGNISLGIS
jgi:hypothetical protein